LLWTYREKVKTIAWSKTINKEAQGHHGLDLGRVQAVEPHYVQTVKGLIRKDTFFIPRDLAQAFDGTTVWFGVEPGLEHQFRRTDPPTEEEYARASLVQSLGTRLPV
jgi:hypothetical protein